jgi:hypothetical protein
MKTMRLLHGYAHVIAELLHSAAALNELFCPQRLCQSQATAEITELLEGYKQRCLISGVDFPSMVVVDNCCHSRGAIQQPFPDTHVVLDIYHLMAR